MKGSNGAGYSWDGCSPKWKIKDIYFGTPEAVLAKHSLRTKTFYASLVHDALYQFAYELKYIMKRKEADRAFYHLLERDGFRFARLYYFAVRATSWMFWHTKKHKADYHTKKEK